jgi:pimeloyl-ACP methyl ester carboxylesterase
VAILVAVGMFRASGAMDFVVRLLDPLTSAVGFPGEALPMALLRPLSGSGALGIMADTLEAHGPDSFVGMLVSTLQGSTETTFYVLTLYAGAGRVRELRHALPACLAPFLGRTVEQPSFYICGEFDTIAGNTPEAHQAMRDALPDLRGFHVLDGAGHWLQQERAEAVNDLLIGFLNDL